MDPGVNFRFVPPSRKIRLPARRRNDMTTTAFVLGKPTEFLWMLASLVMAAQVVTGVLMWWNARRGRRRVQGRGA
jgi:hypothetical protein